MKLSTNHSWDFTLTRSSDGHTNRRPGNPDNASITSRWRHKEHHGLLLSNQVKMLILFIKLALQISLLLWLLLLFLVIRTAHGETTPASGRNTSHTFTVQAPAYKNVSGFNYSIIVLTSLSAISQQGLLGKLCSWNHNDDAGSIPLLTHFIWAATIMEETWKWTSLCKK